MYYLTWVCFLVYGCKITFDICVHLLFLISRRLRYFIFKAILLHGVRLFVGRRRCPALQNLICCSVTVMLVLYFFSYVVLFLSTSMAV